MAEVLPNYDVERVYESDIKKLVQWYNTLQKGGYITPESFVAPAAEETAEVSAEVTEEVKEKKAPAKKSSKKKKMLLRKKKPAKKNS